MKKAARIIVQGTVQGIFFRQFIKGEAEKLKLTGFIRNLDNGDVELIVEGDGEGIGRMSRICEKGPERSGISNGMGRSATPGPPLRDFKRGGALHAVWAAAPGFQTGWGAPPTTWGGRSTRVRPGSV